MVLKVFQIKPKKLKFGIWTFEVFRLF